MASRIFLTILASFLGISLVNSPLKKYQLFNMLMDFLGAGGIG